MNEGNEFNQRYFKMKYLFLYLLLVFYSYLFLVSFFFQKPWNFNLSSSLFYTILHIITFLPLLFGMSIVIKEGSFKRNLFKGSLVFIITYSIVMILLSGPYIFLALFSSTTVIPLISIILLFFLVSFILYLVRKLENNKSKMFVLLVFLTLILILNLTMAIVKTKISNNYSLENCDNIYETKMNSYRWIYRSDCVRYFMEENSKNDVINHPDICVEKFPFIDEGIKSDFSLFRCFDRIILDIEKKGWNKDSCNQSENQFWKNTCYVHIINITKDYSLCEELTDSPFVSKQDCYLKAAVDSLNVSYCEKIKATSSNKNWCYRELGLNES